ncbi:FtsJ-like methyltransferase-domain-containing protein [Pelagophyceae sp. CCMP2097]|nr:FtsJ-like methyltransferase-domain-containing protein [Pelagophyceae sp. CCMP2097]
MGKFSKDKRDAYYRIAKDAGLRSRAGFKIIQLDEKLQLLAGVTKVVDLCSAPGGWSQVCAATLAAGSTIVAVDLKAVAPIDGVVRIIGDITDEETLRRVEAALGGSKAELVLCDGAPDVVNLGDVDAHLQHQLVLCAVDAAMRLIDREGTFVSKVYRGRGIADLFARLDAVFEHVTLAKPRTSRNVSLEAFVVCRGLRSTPKSRGETARHFPFVACGSGDDYDADASYPLDFLLGTADIAGYVLKAPVQMPLNPTHLAAVGGGQVVAEASSGLALPISAISTKIPASFRADAHVAPRCGGHTAAFDADSLRRWLADDDPSGESVKR